KFQTGRQIASGPSVYAVDGKEYVAVTVGGTVTSSSGGTVASQLQVFALGGSQTQSPTFTIAAADNTTGVSTPPRRIGASARAAATPTSARKSGSARIATPQGHTIKAWD